MASYEVEHSIPQTPPNQPNQQQPPPRRRPDLSTFFTALEYTDTTHSENPHVLPIPQNVSATFRTAANAYMFLRGEGGSRGGRDSGREGGNGRRDLLQELIEELMGNAEVPPRVVEGVPDGFLDGLERVPKSSLNPTDDCPICSQPFLSDEYPLVVRLPCHKDHLFDLECIQPWLKLHSTCPLDRKDLLKREKATPAPPREEGAEDEDGEYDDMYA